MRIIKSEYVTSAVGPDSMPQELPLEVMFLGRSNVGKSSFINALTNRKMLARTGKTPGKTQTLNFYIINNEFYLIDAPGYGYQQKGKGRTQEFGKMIESVLKTIHCEMPRQRIIVNLAPADIKKEGSLYDLPIALCILHSSYQYYFNNLDQCLILGELALDGTLRPIKGVLSMAIMAKNNGLKYFILPEQNANEASIVEGLNVIPVKNIHEANIKWNKQSK